MHAGRYGMHDKVPLPTHKSHASCCSTFDTDGSLSRRIPALLLAVVMANLDTLPPAILTTLLESLVQSGTPGDCGRLCMASGFGAPLGEPPMHPCTLGHWVTAQATLSLEAPGPSR